MVLCSLLRNTPRQGWPPGLVLGSGVCIFLCLVSITAGSAVFAKDSSNRAAGGAVVAFLYLFSPACNFGLNSNLGLYITEILLSICGMRGQACFQLFATCFSLLSTYAVPVDLQNMAWKFYLIFVPWVAIEFVVVYFVYPETKGPSLEEIAMVFDGPSGTTFLSQKIADVEHAENEGNGMNKASAQIVEKVM